MTLPDSGWLKEVLKAPPAYIFAVGVSTGFVLFSEFDISSPPWFKPLLALLCIAAWVIATSQLSWIGWHYYREWNSVRIKRPFSKLSDRQKKCLEGVFRSGKRIFEIPNSAENMRWFEELTQWNYVEQQMSGFVVLGDTNTSYAITENGWRELEQAFGPSA